MKNPYASIPPAIGLLATVTLISRSGSMVIAFMPLYLTHQLHLTIATAGQILSGYGLGELMGSYLGGTLADRIGYLTVQTVGLLVVGLLYCLLGSLTAPLSISMTLLLVGLFIAGIRPATSALIASLTTAELRPRAYALHYQALNLGFCLGTSLGGLLFALHTHWLFRVDSLASLTAALIVWLFFKSKLRHKAQTTSQLAEEDKASPLRHPPFLGLLCLVLLIGMCFFLISALYPFYLKEQYHLSVKEIGIILALNGLLIMVGQMQLTTALKNRETLRMIGSGGLVMTMGFFILPFYHGFYYASLSMVLITLGEMVAVPFIYHHVAQIAPSHLLGKYQGLVNCALMSLPLAITPTMASYVYTTIGANALWFGVGMMGLFIYMGFEALSRFNAKNHMSINDKIFFDVV